MNLKLWRAEKAKKLAEPADNLQGEPQKCEDCNGTGWFDKRGKRGGGYSVTVPCGICGGYGRIDPARESLARLRPKKDGG